MSKVVQFGTAFSVNEQEIEDRYPEKRDEVIKYRQGKQLHELVDKLIEVKGDELWEVGDSIPGIDRSTTFTARLLIFTEDEMKEHDNALLKKHGLL